jgi:hypothetical protein
MKTRLIVALTALWWLIAASAAAQPLVRVTIRQKPPLLVGEQVQIDVQLYVPNFFMSAPKFPTTLEIAGALVTMPDDSGVNLNDTINGQSYAGIQKTYVFVAQAAGRYTLPPEPITFRYAVQPGQPADGSVRLPATVIEIVTPKGAGPPVQGQPAALVTTVAIRQTLDRDPSTLSVGDALTRTLVITAAHTQAMFIPPPRFTAPDGVRVYEKDPILSDEREDRVGLVAGRRTDRAIYTFDRPGAYVLPAIEISWFDTASNQQRISRAPEIAVTVRGNSAAVSQGIAPEPEPSPPPASNPVLPFRRIAEFIAVIAAFAVAVAVLWRPAVRAVPRVKAAGVRLLAAIRRDRATHLPPLNPV